MENPNEPKSVFYPDPEKHIQLIRQRKKCDSRSTTGTNIRSKALSTSYGKVVFLDFLTTQRVMSNSSIAGNIHKSEVNRAVKSIVHTKQQLSTGCGQWVSGEILEVKDTPRPALPGGDGKM
jgi:hypothetical protein